MCMRRLMLGVVALATGLLVACSGTSLPKPAELQALPALPGWQTLWSTRLGEVRFPLVVGTAAGRVAVADSRGALALIDVASGKDLWRVSLPEGISAGVGSDGAQLAVVNRLNELVTFKEGRELWRAPLAAESFTPPLIAGGRVFVLTANRGVSAFDAANGRKLWSMQRPGDPLVLRQAGVLMPFKNTLVVGFSGRLVGIDPDRGAVRWDTAVASPRGTNDMERLVDLLGPANRQGDMVCVRAYQSQVGCVDAERGQTLWARPSVGDRAVTGDESRVWSVLSNGVIQAHARANGDKLWESDRLKYRKLSAPLALPQGLLVADSAGVLFQMSSQGELLGRHRIEGGELAAAPVWVGSRIVVVTREGHVHALQLP